MLRFMCPRCKSILESPEQKAGDKVSCPKCQQRLQVPIPALSKTVLAPLVVAPQISPCLAGQGSQVNLEPIETPSPPQAIPVHQKSRGWKFFVDLARKAK